jgi:hypothetical protein
MMVIIGPCRKRLGTITACASGSKNNGLIYGFFVMNTFVLDLRRFGIKVRSADDITKSLDKLKVLPFCK